MQVACTDDVAAQGEAEYGRHPHNTPTLLYSRLLPTQLSRFSVYVFRPHLVPTTMSLGPPCSDDDVFRPTLQTTMSLGPPCPDDDVFRPTLFRVFHFSVYMRYSVPGYIAHTQHVCCTCGELARHAFDVHPGFFAPHRAVPSVQCRVASNTVMSRRPGAKVLVVYTDKEVLCALGPGKHYEVVLAVHRQQPFVAPVRLLVDVQFYPEHAVSERVFLDASQ
jgi:hypothetical protein